MTKPGPLKGVTILQVIPDLAAGGAERTVVEMAEAITRSGGKALVTSAGGRLEGELTKAGGELIPNASLRSKNPLTIHKNAGWLSKIVKQHGVDLIHARSRAPAWSAYWAAKRTQTPFVTTYHGAYGGKSAFKHWYNSVMARGDRVIANSDYIAAHVAATYPEFAPRIVTIPRGVDMAAFDPDRVAPERVTCLRAQWLGESRIEGPIFLLPGRLTRWKGQLDAIRAMAGVKAALGEASGLLVLMGDAQGRDAYVDELSALIIELRLSNHVRIAGHCSDMPAALLAADIILAPSRQPEAFGRVAAEAGAMGRPVIAADHGGQREIVEDGGTGRLVRPGTPEALSNAIVELARMDETMRAVLGSRARERIAERFTKAGLQTATLSVYRDLLDGKTIT